MSSKHKPELGLKELKSFIESVKLDATGLSGAHTDTKGVYRKFHALLIFDYLLQENLEDKDQSTYAREAISDMSHGFFLTFIGLYKPARTSTRSAIENLIRFLLLHRGVDAMSINSVYELFDEAKSSFSSNAAQLKRVGELHGIYRELCKTVHSSSADYMNLEVPFNTMLAFDEDKFSKNRDVLRESCKAVGELLFIEFNHLVQSAHHSHKDILSDSVSGSVRKEARELREAV
ncbi:hypothetical protein [Tritonibacter mobilis]|uniref:hypothetical protein n=1 Tax=Tritonibacter mobilis TaxID=379347 RepID=UPI000806F00C|nr:hypothetical protein [Tritonibacter mobilis]